MSIESLLSLADPSEPLGLLVSERSCPEAFHGARCERIEFSSRGDRVPGRLLLPADGAGPFPLILLQHGAGGDKDAAYLDCAAPWVRSGAAVATIDLPLHGERSSAKFSERFLHTLGLIASQPGHQPDDRGHALLTELARQSVCDLGRCLDALAEHPSVDAARVGYAGFSLGGVLGALFCAVDARPASVVLALAGGGIGPPEIDPCNYVARIAPRPLLLVEAIHDEVTPRASSDALFAAAGEPKQRESFEAGHDQLPGVALKAMWQFLASGIGLGRAA